MSIWVVAYCKRSVVEVTAADVAEGIAERLELLTYLFCPEDEEDPRAVLQRLRIVDLSGPGRFDRFHIFYRREPERFIPADRLAGSGCDAEVREELERLALIGVGRWAEVTRVKQALAMTRERVAFELKVSDANGMGWPLAVAAAAWFVDVAGGIVRGGSSWMVPSGREVRFVLNE